MKTSTILALALLLLFNGMNAQEIIKLPKEGDAEIQWNSPEREYFSDIWQTQVITNVSVPEMEVYRPDAASNTGTAVIIAPGGALYAHSIISEGRAVAKWLAEKGVTGFVLKYRLVPTGHDGVEDVSKIWEADADAMFAQVAKVLPFSITDGLNAVAYVRENADHYGIQTDKIGFMGFSAGGAVTMGVGYGYNEKNRPNFLVPVYPWTDAHPVEPVQNDAPPMLIVCATDDPLGLAKGSIELYNAMHSYNKNVALHLYAKGGHGFGMNQQGLPSDTWIERFYEWALSEHLIENPMN